MFTDFDINLFKAGKHFTLYEKLGSKPMQLNGTDGTYFAVWAPNANQVNVIGNFNYWDTNTHALYPRWDHSGIWEGFIPHIGKGDIYKYAIHTKPGTVLEKGDPYALAWEVPPKTASVIWDLAYRWQDSSWMQERGRRNALDAPHAVYEMHIGSWKRNYEENGRSLSYRELATDLTQYIKEMGFTHVEFMPVMEHPFFGSWGYQVTGYFAPSSRYGTPQDFMYLVDTLHQNGIGVILDWVPSHFPGDAFGPYRFDGTALYEHEDPRLGYHPDWKSYIFNYGRNEVRAFLISNAIFWLDVYHADGLRVDAVASMLYLDYSRKHGEWIPNIHGGNENLEAISFLKEFNETVYSRFPDVQTIAEESTAWRGVSRPTFSGGLGFGMKWMMGWMHDTLEYFSKEPVYRKYHHNEVTFSLLYMFTENFMLPLSHDEVVYGKHSMIYKMPGDDWQRFANLRALYTYMYTHPGAKLLFMGAEIAQTAEWAHDEQVAWHLLQFAPHQGMKAMVTALNGLYRQQPALFEKQFGPEGFEWIDNTDYENSVMSYLRKGHDAANDLLVVCHFTPVARSSYRVGVPVDGEWEEILNSDHTDFGGSGVINSTPIVADRIAYQGRPYSIDIQMPPLAVSVWKRKSVKPASKPATESSSSEKKKPAARQKVTKTGTSSPKKAAPRKKKGE